MSAFRRPFGSQSDTGDSLSLVPPLLPLLLLLLLLLIIIVKRRRTARVKTQLYIRSVLRLSRVLQDNFLCLPRHKG